ncbi:hypothetical protein L228DRAFT_269923 [Xylona heveae TC161]|uniref:t-SNARE coiled-coil homology domain-containing protein n=1 Tax=Xylona heveae (strain CBS 132557 / TC161) TaxID=1328760 RepID=A0A165AKA2_XYLHT|nr:hypothetical protein L228DRAFT_269923 [Xylona heveae TC161]KZF20621.1 hypothetical protein L228DRAFT_269923 [Xylona heveae TC161]
MSSRFGHQRDPRNSLFESYNASRNPTPSPSGLYAEPGYGLNNRGASPGSGLGYRSATPNKRGQYSDAVLSELESQNDEQLEGMGAKVKMLKDITVAIGHEIRSSTTLADQMNDSFDNTRVRLRGTMNRMLRMAESTGVSWKAWASFFAAVIFLFWWVWLG